MKCPICGTWDWTDGSSNFRRGHTKAGGQWCRGIDGPRQAMTLKEVFDLIADLRQELRERAEAHEEAVREIRRIGWHA